MITTVLDKQQVIDILKMPQEIICFCQSSETGVNILYDIEKILTTLNYCTKNIVQFVNIQRQIPCIFEDMYNVLSPPYFTEIRRCILTLQQSVKELDG
jgi:hypothetical protein